jgi:hypothetical protein
VTPRLQAFSTVNLPEIEKALRGARIERVLIGPTDGKLVLAVLTDRIHPEHGQPLALIVDDPKSVDVAAFTCLPVAKLSPESA